MQKNNLLVCDFGFSAMKWMFNDASGRIPAVYKRFDANVFVGDTAMLDADCVDIQTIDDLVRMYPHFTKEAIALSGITGGFDLAVGLPYEIWKTEQKKRLCNECSIFDSLQKSLLKHANSLMVLPQGLGGITSYVSRLDTWEGNILGVDVGFNTVIITLFDSKSKSIVKDHTFFGKGVKDLAINYLMPKIHHHIGHELSPIQISHLMEKGNIRLPSFEKVEIRKEIDSSAKTYCSDLLSYLMGYIKSKWASVADFDTIVFFGGGSRLFKEPPTSQTIKIVVEDAPEFSNCKGFSILADQAEKFVRGGQ